MKHQKLCMLLILLFFAGGCAYPGARTAQRSIEQNELRSIAGRPPIATELIVSSYTGAAPVMGRYLIGEIEKINPRSTLLVCLPDRTAWDAQRTSSEERDDLLFLGPLDAFDPACVIAPVALAHGALIVRADSACRTPEDLWQALSAEPELRVGGNTPEDAARYQKIRNAAGLQAPLNSFVLCPDRSALLLLGYGELDVVCVDSLEIQSAVESGGYRVLLSTSPHARYGAPTCEERYGMAPDECYALAGTVGMSPQARAYWNGLLTQILPGEAWRTFCEGCGWDPCLP